MLGKRGIEVLGTLAQRHPAVVDDRDVSQSTRNMPRCNQCCGAGDDGWGIRPPALEPPRREPASRTHQDADHHGLGEQLRGRARDLEPHVDERAEVTAVAADDL